MHSWPDHSSETFTDLYEIDGCFVDEETYQAKWQELYEEQEYVLIGYEDGLLLKEAELELLLSEAIDDLSVRRDMACFSYENRRKYEKDIYATVLRTCRAERTRAMQPAACVHPYWISSD